MERLCASMYWIAEVVFMSDKEYNILNIKKRIIEYKRAYENIGVIPPPFYVTVQEWKTVFEEFKALKANFDLPRDAKWDDIKLYFGVPIEIVLKL